MTPSTKGLQPRTPISTRSSHCLLLSRASKWAGKIKSREPFGGTVSDLGDWSLEVKDGGWDSRNSEGRGLRGSAMGLSMVLKCSRMD